jgi:hypothetical protein
MDGSINWGLTPILPTINWGLTPILPTNSSHGISQYYELIPELDGWLRRRLRMCYWK